MQNILLILKIFYTARRLPDEDYWETSLGASEFNFSNLQHINKLDYC